MALFVSSKKKPSATSSPEPTPSSATAEPTPVQDSPADTANDAVRSVFDYAVDHTWWLLGLLAFSCVVIIVLAVRHADSTAAWWGKIRASFTWRALLLSSAAAALAWAIAAALGSSLAAFAAMAALVTSQVAMRGSWRVGLETVAGSVAALLVASWMLAALGPGAVTVGLVALGASAIGVLVARENGQWVAVTAVIAVSFGTGLTEVALIDRILATVIGVAVGAAVSPLAHPARALLTRAEQAVGQYSSAVSALITATVTNPGQVPALQSEVDDTGFEARAAVDLVVQAHARRDNLRVQELCEDLRELRDRARQSYVMAAAAHHAHQQGLTPPTQVQEALRAVATAVNVPQDSTGAWQVARTARREATRSVRDGDYSTGQFLLAGSLLGNAELMAPPDVSSAPHRQPAPAEGPELADTQPLPVLGAPDDFLPGWFRPRSG